MKYIQLFDNHEQHLTNVVPESVLLTLCKHENHVHYNIANDDYANECFSIKILSGTNAEIRLNYDPSITTNSINVARIKVTCNTTTGVINVNDAINNYEVKNGTNGLITIDNLNEGDQIWLYRPSIAFKEWTTLDNDNNTVYHGPLTFETIDCTISVQGNIMSLFTPDTHPNLVTDNEIASSETGPNYNRLCMKMFQSQQVIYAHNLILPLKILRIGMYNYMFASTPIKTIPQLPATTLANSCYYAMFYNCRQLEDVSYLKLPADTLPASCYRSMFSTCTSLKKVMPELHGTCETPSNITYNMAAMFYKTAISYAPAIHMGDIGRFGCASMFSNCSELTDFTEFSWSGTMYQYGFYYGCSTCGKLKNVFPQFKTGKFNSQHHYNHAFYNCTSLEKAPKINVPTTYAWQFYYCFSGCQKLNYVDASDVITHDANSCTSYMLWNVANNGTFIKKSGVDWNTNPVSGQNGIPSGWTVISVDDNGNVVTNS